MYILTSFIFIRYYHFNPISLNFLEQEGVEVLVLSDNIDRATQKGFKVCLQTDYQEKLRGHFYIDIYIAAIVVLVSCYRTKEAQGGDAEGVLQFFGMRWRV